MSKILIIFFVLFSFSARAETYLLIGQEQSIQVPKTTKQLIQACNLLPDPKARLQCLSMRKTPGWKKIEPDVNPNSTVKK